MAEGTVYKNKADEKYLKQACIHTTTTDLKEMTAVEQLEYVEKYLFELSTWAGTPKTLEDLYMIILWPKAVGKGSSYVMWEKGGTNNMEYVQNAPLDLDGDGKIIVSEAIKKVIDRRDNNFKKK